MLPRAERDLVGIYAQINAGSSQAALKWYRGLKTSIRTLEHNPGRCPATPENPELRHLLLGKKPHVYRVIYRVLDKQKQVDVLHIRHGAMGTFR